MRPEIRIDLNDSFRITNDAKPITPAQWPIKLTQDCVYEKALISTRAVVMPGRIRNNQGPHDLSSFAP